MNDRAFSRLYYNEKSPAYLSGAINLYREAKKRDKKVTYDSVRDWLERQRVYTLHKPVRKRFPRAKTWAAGLSTHVHIDLTDLRKYKYHNSHYAWILCAIDTLSRQARAKPIKSKHADQVLPALQEILESFPHTVWKVYADKGIM